MGILAASDVKRQRGSLKIRIDHCDNGLSRCRTLLGWLNAENGKIEGICIIV